MDVVPELTQDRINLRLKRSAKRTFERAASLEGKTVSSFILASALAHAEKTIQKHEVMRLNSQDSEAFFHALVSPVCCNKKLSAAFDEYAQRIISQ